ncbi:uncharacterized protein N0V89_009030 [Didymosphaeria variabile]|uniref:Uncharacterized protein n=1 Tax=Didymosphaeria variabile TaxID=1932322 RepID=A0A9W8XGV5_9PLEO|nr:uncharacterized protein N0V89_009030 [Didymosphaeria variabile]KAJ4350409.1 hypothetical protein N0V89_009030 [Didymosphaeria variabile]
MAPGHRGNGSATNAGNDPPDGTLKVALDMVASGLGDVVLVEEMLEKELSAAAKAIIAGVASGRLNVPVAHQHLTRLLQQFQVDVDVVLTAALELLVSDELDTELMEAMLGISITAPMRAVLNRVASKILAPSDAQPHLKRLINIANAQCEIHTPTSPTIGQVPKLSPRSPSEATSEKRESARNSPTLSIAASETPVPIVIPSTSSVTHLPPTILHMDRIASASLAQVVPSPTQVALPPITQCPAGDLVVQQRKRARSEEDGDDRRGIKRVSVQTGRRDSSMNFNDMITHIIRVTRRPPTGEHQSQIQVPKEVGYFATTNFAPYGPGHPDKAGRVNTAHYGSTNERDLGLCYATWCRDDRQCLVGKDCPWRHYLDVFAIGYIWRCGDRQEGHAFLLKAIKNLQAGNHEPVHTHVPIPKDLSR